MTTGQFKLAAVLVLAGGLLAGAGAFRAPAAAGDPQPDGPAPGAAPNPGQPRPPAGRGAGVNMNWTERKVLDHPGWLVGSVAYSPDGRLLVAGGTGRVAAYDAATLRELWAAKVDGDAQDFAAVAFSADGKTVAVTFADGVKFLEAGTGRIGDVLEEKGSRPIAVGFFPDRLTGQDGVPPVKRVIFGNDRRYVVRSGIEWATASGIELNYMPGDRPPPEPYAVPLAVDPRGKRVASNGPIEKETGKSVFWAWSAGSGEANHVLGGHTAAVTAAAWSADGNTIVSGDAGGVVILWDAATFKEKARLNLHFRIAAVALSPDGKYAAAAIPSLMPAPNGTGDYSEEVFVWETAGPPKQPKPISRHDAGGPFRGVVSLAFSPDGKSLAAGFCNFTHLARLGELNGKVRVWTLAAAEPRPEPPAPPPQPPPAADVRTPVDLLRTYELERTQMIRRLGANHPDVIALDARIAFIKARLARQAEGLGDWKEKAVLTHHAGPVDSVAFAPPAKWLVPGGKWFVSGGADGRVLTWNAATLTPQELGRVVPPGACTAVAVSPDGKLVAATRGDLTGFFDPVKRQTVLMRPPFPGGRAVAFSPDGRWVCYSDGYTSGFRQLPPGDGAASVSGPEEVKDQAGKLPAAVAWAPDSNHLAHIISGGPGGNGRVGILGVWRNSNPGYLDGHVGAVTAVAWSPDGKTIASGGADGHAILWDAETHKELRKVRLAGLDGGSVSALAFSPDGRRLAGAVALKEGKVGRLFPEIDTATGERGQDVALGGAPAPRSVAFSPDGRLLVTACGVDRSLLKPLMTPDEMKAAGGVVVWERAREP